MALDDRIARLEAKLRQAKEAKLKSEARKRAASSKRERQNETRRKVLVGALVLARAEQDESQKAELRAMLDAALTRPDDRALFGLPSPTP